jgi:hypothetical protein
MGRVAAAVPSASVWNSNCVVPEEVSMPAPALLLRTLEVAVRRARHNHFIFDQVIDLKL